MDSWVTMSIDASLGNPFWKSAKKDASMSMDSHPAPLYVFNYWDDSDGTVYDSTESFGMQAMGDIGKVNGTRLQKRDLMMASMQQQEPIAFYFDYQQKRFYIQLKEHPSILNAMTRINVHREGQDPSTVKTMEGRAFIGEKLVVIEIESLPRFPSKNITEIMSLTEQPGVQVKDDEIFGRFYIDSSQQDKKIVNGGFVFDGNFIKVQNAEHPISRVATMMKVLAARKETRDDSLVISSQNVEQAGKFPMNKNTTKRYRCGHDNLKYNTQPHGAASFFGKLLGKDAREDKKTSFSFANSLHDHDHQNHEEGEHQLQKRAEGKCLPNKMVLYMGIVADCAYMEAFRGDAAQAQANIINDFNLASAIYEESFNIQLGLISIDLMMDCSSTTSNKPWNVPCSQGLRMEDKLNMFSAWRSSQSKDAGVFHLVSGCSDSDVVGIAWLGQVCQARPYTDPSGDSVSGTAVTVFLKNQFAVIAHELGHNFGAIHDCDSDACALCADSTSDCKCCTCGTCDCKGQFLMHPESGGLNVKKFSACAQKDICQKLPVLGSCLKEPGSLKTIRKGTCGDGIRDEGEECDCGGPEKCKDNACCTVECKLKSGAVCSDTNDRCCRECQLIPTREKFVCHPGNGICQKASYCDGQNRDCPKTHRALDGAPCEKKGGRCASGQCTSRSKQCAAVGSRLGLTEECPDQFASCNIVCQSGNSCIILDATFIDGTVCGYDGRCYKGVCSEPIYKTLFLRNLVPLGVFIGIILAILVIIIVRKLLNARRR